MSTTDPTAPNGGLPYSSINKVHDFDDAKDKKDGITLSRWRRKRDTPFGDEFDYTDPHDLTGRFQRSGDRWTRMGRMKMTWRVFMSRFTKKPVAWVTVDYDEVPIYENNPEAYLMSRGEVRISPVEHRVMFPIYKDYEAKALITMNGYEETQAKKEAKRVRADD